MNACAAHRNPPRLLAEAGPAPPGRLPRAIVLWSGHFLFGLGAVGLALPLFPTTVFWLGAAACYARSAPHLRARIFAWPVVGRPIRDLLVDGTASRRTKLAALAGMAAGAAGAALVPTGGAVVLVAAKAVTLGLMAAAALYLLRLPPVRRRA